MHEGVTDAEVKLQPNLIPGVQVGDLLEISQYIDMDAAQSNIAGQESSSGTLHSVPSNGSINNLDKLPMEQRKKSGTNEGEGKAQKLVRVVLPVTQASLKEGKTKDVLFIHTTVATQFGFLPRNSDCVVKLVKPEAVALSAVEFSFSNQYISRSDLWLFRFGFCVVS